MKRVFAVLFAVSLMSSFVISCIDGSNVFKETMRVSMSASPNSLFATKDGAGHEKTLKTIVSLQNAHFSDEIFDGDIVGDSFVKVQLDKNVSSLYSCKFLKDIDSDDNSSIVCLLSPNGDVLADTDILKSKITFEFDDKMIIADDGVELPEEPLKTSVEFTRVNQNKEEAHIYAVQKSGEKYYKVKEPLTVSKNIPSEFTLAVELLANDSFNKDAVSSYNPLSDISSWFSLTDENNKSIDAKIKAVATDMEESSLSNYKDKYYNRLIVDVELIPASGLIDTQKCFIGVSIPSHSAVNGNPIRINKSSRLIVNDKVECNINQDVDTQTSAMYFDEAFVSPYNKTTKVFESQTLHLHLINIDESIFKNADSIFDIFTITSSNIDEDETEQNRLRDECDFTYVYNKEQSCVEITIPPHNSLLDLYNRSKSKFLTFSLNDNEEVRASVLVDLSSKYWM